MSKSIYEKQITKRVKGEARKLKQLLKATINKDGEEVLDEQPLFNEIGYKQPPSINDKIRQITLQVQAETAAKMAAQNMTPEQVKRIMDEEDDFDIPEDLDNRLTSYEMQGQMADLEEEYVLEPEVPLTEVIPEPPPATPAESSQEAETASN